MLRRVLFSVFFIFLIAAFAHAQTVDEVIAKYLEARGGAKELKAIRTERIAGHLSFGPGAEGPFTVEFARPFKMHMVIDLGSQKITRICDGASGWLIVSTGNSEDMRAMTADEVKNATREVESAFGGPFPDYKTNGAKVVLAGREAVGGTETLKLDVTYPDGTLDSYFIDARTFLPIKWEGQRTADGKPVVYVSWFRTYMTTGWFKSANFIESGVKGDPKGPGQNLKIDKLELDVPVDDALFQKPESAIN